MSEEEQAQQPEVETAPPVQELSKEEQLEKEVKECQDKHLRLLAEMDNMRKRMQKERQETIKFAIEGIIAEILQPLDNFENALNFTSQMSGDVQTWAAGFQMILAQFKEVLSQNGVTTFQSEGKPFDPHQHEAVEVEETDQYPEGTVIKEFVKGYKQGDRVIRPARVKVAKKISTEKQ